MDKKLMENLAVLILIILFVKIMAYNLEITGIAKIALGFIGFVIYLVFKSMNDDDNINIE